MQNLTIDTGMQEYLINNRAVLRFNPSDPNLYHRFFAAAPKLDALDAELTKQLKALRQSRTMPARNGAWPC